MVGLTQWHNKVYPHSGDINHEHNHMYEYPEKVKESDTLPSNLI